MKRIIAVGMLALVLSGCHPLHWTKSIPPRHKGSLPIILHEEEVTP